MSILTESLRYGKAAFRKSVLPNPRKGRSHQPGEPLIVAGMFQTSNGIGRAASACFNALQAEGLKPVAVDLADIFNQAEHAPELQVSAMPRARRGTLLLFANAPETVRALTGLGLRRWQDWHIIGCWAWELPVIPPHWTESFPFLSEIWVPSEFVASSLGPSPARPLKIVPHHVPVPASSRTPLPHESTGRPFQLLCVADGRSSFHRKNLTAAVRMFRRAFPSAPDVKLVVKCRNLTLYPEFANDLRAAMSEDHRIDVIDRTMDDSEMRALFETSDVIVSAHRSEGFGLVMAEAMALGKPVIATGWSGNLQFMTKQNSWLLPYALEQVDDPTGIYDSSMEAEWAEVDEHAGAQAMKALKDNPDFRGDLGEMARYDIARLLDRGVYSRALGLHLASMAE